MRLFIKVSKLLAVVLLFLVTMFTEVSAQYNKPYFYTRGRENIMDGRYQEAIESLNLLLRSQPDEYEGYFLRGVAKYNLNDMHGSMQDFTEVLDRNPVYVLAYQYRGIVRSRLGMYEDALKDFQKAIEMRPTFAGAYYSRAVNLFLNQQFESSIADYDMFIKLEPLSVEGYVNRGTAKLYLKDTVSAMNDFNRAIQINPFNDDGYLRRGVVYMSQGEIDKGIKDMDSALEIDSTTAIGYFYRAMGYNNKGNIQMALNDFDHAINYDPTNSVAVFNRAILRSQIGDYNRAIDDYALVASQNPQNVLVYYNRAAVYTQIGELQRAVDDYTKAIEIYGDFANAYLYRSSVRAMMGDKRGYNSDKAKAESLIEEYRTTLRSEGNSAFADTSARFSDIISFNADFDDKNLTRLDSRVMSKYRPMPMFRISVMAKQDSVVGVDHLRYLNEELTAAVEAIGGEELELVNCGTDLQNWELMELDMKYSSGSSGVGSGGLTERQRGEMFILGVVNALMRQFSTAMDYYSFLISDNSQNGLVYLNRAVTEAEMTEFMISLQGDYQSVSAQNDPVERLRATKTVKEFDYEKIFQDLYKAAELMPSLAHVYYNLGYMYTVKGDYPLAVESYSRAIELFPYFGEAYYNRGLLQLVLDEREKGALDLSRAGELRISDAYLVIESLVKN